MARRESWSPHVRGVRGELRFYLLDLVQLTLDEEANRPLFVAAPQLRALYMQVEAYTWGAKRSRRAIACCKRSTSGGSAPLAS